MLNINLEIEKSIHQLQLEKDKMDLRVKQLEWELDIYKNLSQCYEDNLKDMYKFKIERGWGNDGGYNCNILSIIVLFCLEIIIQCDYNIIDCTNNWQN